MCLVALGQELAASTASRRLVSKSDATLGRQWPSGEASKLHLAGLAEEGLSDMQRRSCDNL